MSGSQSKACQCLPFGHGCIPSLWNGITLAVLTLITGRPPRESQADVAEDRDGCAATAPGNLQELYNGDELGRWDRCCDGEGGDVFGESFRVILYGFTLGGITEKGSSGVRIRGV